MYEFESLILAGPRQLDWEFIEHEGRISELERMALNSGNPELINDGQNTHPSKRIINKIPEYEGRKASAGPLVADKIGLPTLRDKCRHFNGWLEHLENLAGSQRLF